MSAGNDPNDISRIGVKSVAQHGVPSYVQHDDDDHEEHIDERWLVSYADMMTLLFGLFVLLFSMSTLDPKTANQIKASAEQTFSEKEEEPAPPPPDRTPELEARIAALQAEVDAQEEALKVSEEKAVEASQKVAEQSQKIDWLEDKLSKVPKPKLPEPEKPSREPELEAELKKREREIEKLKTARDEVARQLASASADAPAAAQAAQKAAVENEKLKEELDKMKQDLQTANQTAEEAKEKLKKEVESLNGGRGQDFMAFFINWATKDHDVDLVIQDPSGKTFDFKRREYKSHPGFFALDTRRGPGVELWQSKNILPGRYKATYSLYNDYGNPETAPVNAVILTPKGSFELPLSRLDTKGNRRATAEFEVDKNGGVRIVNAGK